MDSNLIERIAKLLQQSARKRTVLPYPRLHALMPKGLSLNQRYAHLEAAAMCLHDLREFDYGALMALDCGLPGADFFVRFRKHRYADYVSVLGDPRYVWPTVENKRKLVKRERARIYAHAMTIEKKPASQMKSEAEHV